VEDDEVFDAFKKYRGPSYAHALRIFPHSANLMYADFFHFTKNQVYSFKKFVPRLNKIYNDHIKEVVKYKGYKPLYPNHNVTLTAEKMLIEQDDMDYFIKLYNLCRHHHITLYFYRAPVLQCNMKQSKPFDLFIDSFTVANKIPYFDYKCQYQWPDQYYDQNHPTGEISRLVTKDILARMNIMQ
jgi:hypothetical protein